MYMLTKKEGSIESGAYATVTEEGLTMVQFFVDKDDALTYNELLNAVGYDLAVTETPDEHIDKMCDVLGFAYTVAEPGELVIPRAETILNDLSL